jgi:DUF2971 family protein
MADVWDEHLEVYHYTTMAGLNGILGTGTFHATYFPFLNDAKEIYQIKPRIVAAALPIITTVYKDAAAADDARRKRMDEAGGISYLAEHDASKTVDILYDITLGLRGGIRFFQPFIVSFCTHIDDYEKKNGLLSMWRGYGRDSGYAIVFDTKALWDRVLEEVKHYRYDMPMMGDAIYDTGNEIFQNEFKNLIEALGKDVPRIFLEDGPANYKDLNNAFMLSIPRYKHRGFSEEREVRIVVSPTDDTLFEQAQKAGEKDQRESKKICFKDSLAPYIVLFDKAKSRLPIKRIIVGPHADKDRRFARLKSYLAFRGLEIDVSCSETPLV